MVGNDLPTIGMGLDCGTEESVPKLKDEEKRTVKSKLIALAVLVPLMAAVYIGGRSSAQTPAPTPRPLQTRIGLLNMVQVLKNYKKFQGIEDNIKHYAQGVEKSLEPFRTELIRLKTIYQDEKTSEEEKKKIEHRMRQLQLDAQYKEEEAKKELIKMNGDAAVQIYKEVEDAVNLYARSNNLELVLFYNDAVTAEDFYHPANLQRKLTQPAAVMPIFVTPGMDISNQIAANLNAKVTAGGAAAPTAPHN
jgi:Skp family chaperone for outer membrane proteins